MHQIVVDAALSAKLHGVRERVEFVDEYGQLLGWFTPASVLPEELTQEPQLSEEEWKQLEQETETYSTAEVLAYLATLPPPPEGDSGGVPS
jgi:hypothetical protein